MLKLAESFAAVQASAATGFKRHFAVDAPGRYHAWLLAGESAKDPRVMAAGSGKTPRLDLAAADPLVPAAGVRLVLPQEADRALVLEAAGAPEGSVWRFIRKPGGGWLVVLRLPESKSGWKGSFDLMMWALPKDDDALLKELSVK